MEDMTERLYVGIGGSSTLSWSRLSSKVSIGCVSGISGCVSGISRSIGGVAVCALGLRPLLAG